MGHTPILHKVIFYVFVAVYLVTAPVTVLYALGYILKPGSERLVKTGLISLSTFPAGAAVYLGKSRFTERTPVLLRDLLPGRYSVQLKLKGHENWSVLARVRPGEAVAFEKILLLPNDLSFRELSEHSFEQIIPLEKKDSLWLVEDKKTGECRLFDAAREALGPSAHAPAVPLPERPAERFEEIGRRTLVWTKNNIGFLRDRRPAAGPEWLFRGGDNITQVFRLFNDRYFLVNDSARILFVGLEIPGEPRVRKIADIRRGTLFHYVPSSGRIYYLDPPRGRLYRAQVLSERKTALA